MIKISYSLWQKNKNRGDTTYWCRVRERGRSPMDVNLHTKSKAQAEAFVMLRKHELDLYNAQLLAGEQADASKLLRRGMPTTPQKGPCKAVSSLRACLDAWEADLTRRGFSARTVHMYCKSCEYMLKDLSKPVSALTPELVRKQSTEHDHLRCTTRRSYFVAYREFLKYCIKQYNISPAVLDELPMIRQVHTDRPHWTIAQAISIINSVSCNSKEVEDCYKTWFWFLLVTGARQGESAALTWDNVNNGIVTFTASTTKGNKTRRVPVEWRVMSMLYKLPRKGKLVFSDLAKSQAGRYSVLARAIRRAGAPLGGLHTWRHTASTYLYSRTSDIKATAEMLGHSASVALQYYQASRTPDQLRDVVAKAFGDDLRLPDAMDDLIKAGLI